MLHVRKLVVAATLALSVVSPLSAQAEVTDGRFDFSDDYYRQNGIDPAKLAGRKQSPSATAVVDAPYFSYQRNVRII